MASQLTQRLVEVCDEALARLSDGPARRVVDDVRAALGEPLRVVVAGRVSSGKSTLVNALIGERIAQTAAGECTKLVTWFRYGSQEYVEVHPRKGAPTRLPFGPSKSMPTDLGLATDDIGHLVVYLKNPLLRRVTIIDTPGLEALTKKNVARTVEFFGGAAAQAPAAPRGDVARIPAGQTTSGDASDEVARTQESLGIDRDSSLAITQAEALVYLMAHTGREGDQLHLEQFRSAFRGGNVSVLNAIGVLNKVDTIDGEHPDDPWPAARRIAKRHAVKLGSLLRDLLPVIAVVAQTTRANAFTERDAIELEKLAKCSPDDRYFLLLDVNFFRDPALAPDVPVERRERLLDLLGGRYAIGVALDLIDQGCRGAAQLIPELYRRSGFDELREVIEGTFARRSEIVKAGAALAKLEKVTYWTSEPDNARDLLALRKALEPIQLDAGMHALEQMRSMQLISAGEARFSKKLYDELVTLTDKDEPWERLGLSPEASLAEMEETARRLASDWNGRENMAFNRHNERVARMAKEAYTHLWQDLLKQLSQGRPS